MCTELKDCSHLVVLLLWCRMNSESILSILGVLFCSRYLMADTISSCMNSPERLRSALGALCKLFRSPVVFLVNDLSALGNLQLLISCAAMASAVMGHCVGFDA